MKPNEFEYDGRTLEVRAIPVGSEFQFRVFESERPVGVTTHHLPDNLRFELVAKHIDVISQLQQMAQDDFIRWSEWIKHTGTVRTSED